MKNRICLIKKNKKLEKNFAKEYIEASNEFRKSKASKESVGKLYDLLYELKNADRTKSDDLILSNVYSLLGFHLSAYETFKLVADLTDRKNASKLYVLEDKAKSHKNDFIIKDIRKLRSEIKQAKLLPTDFVKSESGEHKFKVIDKDIVVFNKVVKNDKFEICLSGDHKFEDFTDKIIDYIDWLCNCKKELVAFYNTELSGDTDEVADDDWYDTLDLYGVRIIIGQNGNLYSEISGGDDFCQDHILDIETSGKTISSMSYDG